MTDKTFGDLVREAIREPLEQADITEQLAEDVFEIAYGNAVERLERTGDAKPLATLLRHGAAMPFQSMQRLAVLLDPGESYVGRRLVTDSPKRTRGDAIVQLGKQLLLRARITETKARLEQEEAEKARQENRSARPIKMKERVYAEIKKQTGESRATCERAWALNSDEMMRRSAEILGIANAED